MLKEKIIWCSILFLTLGFAKIAIAKSEIAITSISPIQKEEGPFTQADWHKIFYPSTPFLEIFTRGTIIYLGIFLMLRVLLKREAGAVGMTDLLVIVLLSDASQNAMADNYESVTDGIFLIMVIIFWSHMLNFLGYYFPKLEKFIRPPALPLINKGKIIKKNLRKEFITEEELLSQIREQGIEGFEKVKEAYIESDGKISVISMS
jgi:uncharacterized membrane protein YcaP (DUF421 family)